MSAAPAGGRRPSAQAALRPVGVWNPQILGAAAIEGGVFVLDRNGPFTVKAGATC